MKISQAANLWLNYHRANSSENTIRTYKELLERFCQKNGEKDLKELTPDDVLDFLNGITEGKKNANQKNKVFTPHIILQLHKKQHRSDFSKSL